MNKIACICFCLLFFSGFFFPRAMEISAQEQPAPYPNSHFIVIDSVRIHYRSWNEDPAHARGNVLLIHGFCGSTFCYRENTAVLAEAGYRVVAVDVPGFGYSGRNLVNQSFSNRARILWDLIRAIDPDGSSRWNITGHSMGGGIAEAMALMEPGRTKSLTLIDGMVFLENQDLSGAFVTSARMKGIDQMYAFIFSNVIISESAVRRFLRNVYGYAPDSTVVEGYYRPLLTEGTAQSVITMFARSKEIVPLNASGLKEVPVLVIWGKKDRTIRMRTGKKFKRHVPTVNLRVIPKAHHSPMETHPELFNSLYLEFLDNVNKSIP
jgi:pimeloyl-ACP methyl ester carboxylesterase